VITIPAPFKGTCTDLSSTRRREQCASCCNEYPSVGGMRYG
jgi:hypothetical protein